MARLIAALILLASTCATRAAAQESYPAELDAIRAAMVEADGDRILEHAGDRIEIGLFGATRTYSRSQARFVLQGFFDENPPETMVLDRTTGTEQGWFASADYRSGRAPGPIRVYLRLRRVDDGWQLRELVIRRES